MFGSVDRAVLPCHQRFFLNWRMALDLLGLVNDFGGLDDLTEAETARVVESNRLYLHFLALCESVSTSGRALGWEHPADRQIDPYPPIWVVHEMVNMEARTNSKHAIHHQCPFGGCERPKKKCISGSLEGLEELNNIFCPGVSQSHVQKGKTFGRASEGKFQTKRPQTDPPQYAKEIALRIFRRISSMLSNFSGPSGGVCA